MQSSERYSVDMLNSVLRGASKLLESWQIDTKGLEMPRVIGTLFMNATPDDVLSVNLALARMGTSHVDLSHLVEGTRSRIELDGKLRIADDAVDLLITSFHDPEGLGNGRRIIEAHAKESGSNIINFSDDMFSSQGALGEVLGLQRALGSLRGKTIAISWVFGTCFTSPNIPHSLLSMLPLLGANLKVIVPPPFSLLNRVRRDADTLAKEKGVSIEYQSDFPAAFSDVDAVFALDWMALENFQRPERNAETAAAYREWYLSEEILPTNIPTLLVPQVRSELSVSDAVLSANFRHNHTWFSRRAAALVASILYLIKTSDTWHLL